MLKSLIKEHPFRFSVLCSIVVGCIIFLVIMVLGKVRADEIVLVFLFSLVGSACIFYPFLILVMEVTYLILAAMNKESPCAWQVDQVALWYVMLLEYIYVRLIGATGSDWMIQLTNEEKHTPVYTGSWPIIFLIAVLAIVGYYYLSFRPMKKMPPLMAVISISAMYLGIVELIVFSVQVIGVQGDDLAFMLLIWPASLVLMCARTILARVREWEVLPMEKRKIHQNPILNTMDGLLSKASFWPLWGLILVLPLLGILIAILMLFGQAPDSVIKAWTETADWRLSAKQAPQNIFHDEHYLCTVAAGGHQKIVKPIRMGVRHGHPVIVNRQLCVANAFEQVLEEKTPHFHKAVRAFYDRYGFPIAKMIRKSWVADLVYILMKPLEWIFLIILYLTDVHPENRIAVQYMGKKPPIQEIRHFGIRE